MASSAVRHFTDPDAFAASTRATQAELTLTGGGQFAATLTHVTFSDLWMQKFSDNLPRLFHSATVAGRALISFRSEPGPPLQWGGMEMLPTNLVRLSERQSSFHRSTGASSFSSMSLPIDKMAAIGEAFSGCDLTPPPQALLVTPAPSAIGRLQRLHAAAAALAKTTPEVIANPDAARGLEQTLIHAMVACLSPADLPPDRTARHRHSAIMRRFRDATEANTDKPLYLGDICDEIGTSGRTLQACCLEHLGMGPLRYLWLRRMHLSRRALAMADPSTGTVTAIAGSFGFWELGRFAVAYRKLYGESPHVTLRTPA